MFIFFLLLKRSQRLESFGIFYFTLFFKNGRRLVSLSNVSYGQVPKALILLDFTFSFNNLLSFVIIFYIFLK